jgi:hypothetical protein
LVALSLAHDRDQGRQATAERERGAPAGPIRERAEKREEGRVELCCDATRSILTNLKGNASILPLLVVKFKLFAKLTPQAES